MSKNEVELKRAKKAGKERERQKESVWERESNEKETQSVDYESI